MTTARQIPAAILLALCALTSATATAAGDSLVLRMQEAIGTPGGEAVLSLRTYASRPVGQGQICFAVRNARRGAGRGATSLGDIKGFEVYAVNDDVQQNMIVTRNVDDLSIVLQFLSPSASINALDGPFAAVFFQVDPNLLPGLELEVALDIANTVLFDADGQSIPVETRDAIFRVRDPSAPYEISADADQNEPGGPVRMSFQTSEPFDIGSGQIAIRYSSRMFPNKPQLHIDPRYGFVTLKQDGHEGLAILRISAVNGSFNDLPGDVFQMFVDPHPSMGPGVSTGVSIDPALTVLRRADGSLLPLEFEPGEIDLN